MTSQSYDDSGPRSSPSDAGRPPHPEGVDWAAEIRSMEDPTCRVIAAALHLCPGGRPERGALLLGLLDLAGIDPGPFLLALVRAAWHRPRAADDPPSTPRPPEAP
jgi:hypothetical protein